MLPKVADKQYVGRNPGFSLDYLREKVIELEEIRDAKLKEYDAIMESGNGGVDGSDDIDPEEERKIAKQNAFLRRELARMQVGERQHTSDPRVLERKNLIKSIWKKIDAIEGEIDTLRSMKKRRDRSLREIEWGEENARRVRSENAEVSAQLRRTLKELNEEYREMTKRDLEAHAKSAKLQAMVKLGATVDEVEELQREVEEQEAEIQRLSEKEEEWKRTKMGVRTEVMKITAAEQREIRRLTQELAKLKVVLANKEADLRKVEQEVGNYKLKMQ